MLKATMAAIAATALLATSGILLAQQGGDPQPAGGGTVEACGSAPGGDPSVSLHGPTTAGTLTVTSVTINGTTVPESQYTVNDNGTKTPDVVFHNPEPGAPPEGAEVCVNAVSSRGDEEFDGTLDW